MWGIAGSGTRIQPLAFSKELLPVGSRGDGDAGRPRAVSEYIVERMLRTGADRICFVISPRKADILQYFGARIEGAAIAYVVQLEALGLCGAIFCALPLISPDEAVLVGLPDTVWLPEDGLAALPEDRLAFLTFPVAQPEFFDAVAADRDGRVLELQVKMPGPSSRWIWGAFRMPSAVLHELHALWQRRGRRDEYIRTLVNAYLATGGEAVAVAVGTDYVDVGTLGGYRDAIRLLSDRQAPTKTALPLANFARRGRH